MSATRSGDKTDPLAIRSPVWHEHQLQFHAEFFNVLNRANFNNPVNTFSNPAFGRIQTAGAGRNVQLSLRYQF